MDPAAIEQASRLNDQASLKDFLFVLWGLENR